MQKLKSKIIIPMRILPDVNGRLSDKLNPAIGVFSQPIITILFFINILILSCEKDIEKSEENIFPIELSPSGQSTDTLHPVCVIADFPDSKLEDMKYGLNSVEKIVGILQAIDQHWIWMSHGYQSLQWTVIRTTISQPVNGTGYNGSWYEYRQDVVRHALLQLEVSEHDKNNDNYVDIMFIIASNNNVEPEYLIGGAAGIPDGLSGANTFVDGQNSLSIQRRAIGNFSHEIGHNLGLPDIYGSSDNVQYLTIMSDSWPTPPHTFSAYEKYRLGWAEPLTITETKYGIDLKPGETSLDFLKIPTDDTLEFFLVEYRRRQIVSYTSNAPVNYNGIVIYRVNNFVENGEVLLEKLAVVPADGNDYFTSMLERAAFWYPTNYYMPEDGCSLKKSDGQECGIRLTDFNYTGNGMSLNVIFE